MHALPPSSLGTRRPSWRPPRYWRASTSGRRRCCWRASGRCVTSTRSRRRRRRPKPPYWTPEAEREDAAASLTYALLSSSVTGKDRVRILEGVAAGEVDLAIGTHALVQESVAFSDLSLAVMDEQHRFGLHQRMALKGKGGEADVLIMTATPIPRSLALTYYGDLDVVVLDELPEGTPAGAHARGALAPRRSGSPPTVWCAERSGRAARPSSCAPPSTRAIGRRRRRRRPRPSASPPRYSPTCGWISARSNASEGEAGRDGPLPRRRHRPAHRDHRDRGGRGRAERHGDAGGERGAVRARPAPSAARPDRAGPSGGRCVLFDDSSPANPEARARIDAMVRTTDGFELADEDLRLRGEGTLFDTRQSGHAGPAASAPGRRRGPRAACPAAGIRSVAEDDPDWTTTPNCWPAPHAVRALDRLALQLLASWSS